MADRIVLVQRDGALLLPAQRDEHTPGLRWVAEAIPALWLLRQAGFALILVDSPPEARSRQNDSHTRQAVALCASQGAEFDGVLGCLHSPLEACHCAPEVMKLTELLRSGYDASRSALVAATSVDRSLVETLGIRAFALHDSARGWIELARTIVEQPRTARVERKTRETAVQVEVNLDAIGDSTVTTGIGFFDHMLEQLGKHGGFRLTVKCSGDLEVDEHHTIEDVALTLGEALRCALGDKRGIQRYGFLLPMDEASAEISLDLGGRPYLVFEGEFGREQVGGLPTELVPHFFRSLSDTLGAAVQIRVRGDNAHHMVEACFKGFARALRQAIAREGRDLPSTKGTL
jgi:imidazoleglycerol-phosphate dehydratase/histidinol-phosphatase